MRKIEYAVQYLEDKLAELQKFETCYSLVVQGYKEAIADLKELINEVE